MTAATKQALFDKGLEKDLAYRGAKIRELEIARAQAAARVQEVLDDRNTFLASLVDDQGFKISDICRILHTKNWQTARDAVEAGRAARGAAAPTPIIEPDVEQGDGPYDWDAAVGVLTVTMSQEDFEPYLNMLARHPGPNGETWAFEFVDGRLMPQDHDVDTVWEEPVVQVVMTDAGKAQALAYIESQRKAAA